MTGTLEKIGDAIRGAGLVTDDGGVLTIPDASPRVKPWCNNCFNSRSRKDRLSCGLKGGPRFAESVRADDSCSDFREMSEGKAAKRRHLDLGHASAKAGGIDVEISSRPPPSPVIIRKGLPEDCPVRPLGQSGAIYYYLDGLRQIIGLAAKEHARLHLAGLFGGNDDYLVSQWPRLNKDGDVAGVNFDRLAYNLMSACKQKGIWTMERKVRGRGLWFDDSDGTFVCHFGDEVMVLKEFGARELREPDEIGGYVYPAGERLWRPDFDGVRDEDESGDLAALELYNLFKTWSWRRPMDPLLLLGWVVAGLLGGAASWRPMCFLIGDAGCGKSTLMAVMKHLLGPWLLDTTDTTPAGIRQSLGSDCRPVAVDELEAGTDGKNDNIIELARLSASGGKTQRGSADHKAVEFQTRSAMLFGAINPPAMGDADLSRFALLQLRPLPRDGARPDIDPQHLGVLGRRILGRLIRDVDRLEKRFATIDALIRKAGHGARGADTFGRLLACAELVIGPVWDALDLPAFENEIAWVEMLRASALTETADMMSNWRKCLSHLVTCPVEHWRNGTRPTIGAVIDAYHAFTKRNDLDGLSLKEANHVLQQAGVRIVEADSTGAPERLFIPTRSAQVQRLFWQSDWYGKPGAGGWTMALQQAPDGVFAQDQRSMYGSQVRGTSVRLDVAMGGDWPK